MADLSAAQGVRLAGGGGRDHMTRLEEGWYRDDHGTIYQRWWRAWGSPRHRTGWYVWRSRDTALYGVFPTLTAAIRSFPEKDTP